MLFERRCPACGRRCRFVCEACWSCLQPDPTTGPGLFVYDHVYRELILAAKNRGRRDLLRPLGRALADHLATGGIEAPVAPGDPATSPWVVTWVPCSREGRRTRGYDQGRVLARVVASRLGLVCHRTLWRADEEPQTGRDRRQRLAGPTLDVRRAPVPRRLILIDDVTTTGSSLRAASERLRAAGALDVVTAALAAVTQPRDRVL